MIVINSVRFTVYNLHKTNKLRQINKIKIMYNNIHELEYQYFIYHLLLAYKSVATQYNPALPWYYCRHGNCEYTCSNVLVTALALIAGSSQSEKLDCRDVTLDDDADNSSVAADNPSGQKAFYKRLKTF